MVYHGPGVYRGPGGSRSRSRSRSRAGTVLLYLLSNPVISTGHTSVDIGASGNLEVVHKFWYLGDILSVDGDADAVVEARI